MILYNLNKKLIGFIEFLSYNIQLLRVVGLYDGDIVGCTDGDLVGVTDGDRVGVTDGSNVGS